MSATRARPRTAVDDGPFSPAPRSRRGRLPIVLAIVALCAAVAGGTVGSAHAQTGGTGGTAGTSTSTTASTGTAPTLRRGSRGARVRALQRALQVHVDGVFGRSTARAVSRFQRRHRLPATGRINTATAQALGLDVAAPRAAADPAAPGADAEAVVAAVKSKIGASYASGATGPNAFDCSGLVLYAFRKAGTTLPRTSFAQYGEGTRVAKADIQPGDIVFFNTAGSGASHDGIAISPTTAISATSHGVMKHSISDSYWGGHYVGARRVA